MAVSLLSQTVIALQPIGSTPIESAHVTLPPGCQNATLSCPSMSAADAADPANMLDIKVDASVDGGLTWIRFFEAMWQGNPGGAPQIAAPCGPSMAMPNGWAGAVVRAIASGSGVSTDFACGVTG